MTSNDAWSPQVDLQIFLNNTYAYGIQISCALSSSNILHIFLVYGDLITLGNDDDKFKSPNLCTETLTHQSLVNIQLHGSKLCCMILCNKKITCICRQKFEHWLVFIVFMSWSSIFSFHFSSDVVFVYLSIYLFIYLYLTIYFFISLFSCFPKIVHKSL